MDAQDRPDHAGRLQAFWAHPGTEGLDTVLLTEPIHLRYLTGFTGSSGALLSTRGASVLFTDGRYETQAAREVAGAGVEIVTETAWSVAARHISAGQHAGFEARRMSAADADLLRRTTPAASWQGVDAVLSMLRSRKDPWEVAVLRRAAGIADGVWEEVRARLRPGITEHQVAGMLEESLRRRGSQGSAFEPIVVTGPRSALPHGRATDRVVEEGDRVTLDFGAVVEGYHTDITRSWRLGATDPEHDAWFEVLDRALRITVDVLEAGQAGKEVDAAVRGIIDEAGYGPYFVHNLGHGIGLEVHETPRLARGSTDLLETGMVFTLEPGIYIPDSGGMRLEEDVVLTEEGPVLLTRSSRACAPE